MRGLTVCVGLAAIVGPPRDFAIAAQVIGAQRIERRIDLEPERQPPAALFVGLLEATRMRASHLCANE
jgi:hypothetical protein